MVNGETYTLQSHDALYVGRGTESVEFMDGDGETPCYYLNSMPAHVHDRRMEAYLYLDLPDESVVCHFLGTPSETRQIWVQTRQAVLSPPWSIHSGAGTRSYSFIWGMGGENLDYGDMDVIEPNQLQ